MHPSSTCGVEGGRHDLKGADTLIADAVASFIGRIIAR